MMTHGPNVHRTKAHRLKEYASNSASCLTEARPVHLTPYIWPLYKDDSASSSRYHSFSYTFYTFNPVSNTNLSAGVLACLQVPSVPLRRLHRHHTGTPCRYHCHHPSSPDRSNHFAEDCASIKLGLTKLIFNYTLQFTT